MVPEKNVTEIICDADVDVDTRPNMTTQDDRSDPYMSSTLKRAGDTTSRLLTQIRNLHIVSLF